jgi:ABC-2 type transport system ATP-binding protein
MIEAEDLQKRYGETQALAGVSFSVPAGTILGLLGPNGAGKTTAVRVLTTLARPDQGRAVVAGIDVVKHPGEARRHIGVAAQDATLDPLLTGRQNLVLVGELCDMGRGARARAAALLEQFELTDAAARVLKGYSGGMRRRLDLAASLMTRPPVLFLDEPTTGLDPTSRQRVWEAIRELLDDGVTVLLTTQYLEEADELAHRIVVVDHGRVIADGTPLALKQASRSAHLEVTLSAPSPAAVGAVAPLVPGGVVHVSDDGRRLSAGVDAGTGLATTVVRALDAAGVLVDNIEVRQPSLDDVFFSLTGGHIEGGETSEADARDGDGYRPEDAAEAPASERGGARALEGVELP